MNENKPFPFFKFFVFSVFFVFMAVLTTVVATAFTKKSRAFGLNMVKVQQLRVEASAQKAP